MRNNDYLDKLEPEFKLILENEIRLNNEILDISKGWPNKDSIFVKFEFQFATDYLYLSKNLILKDTNDPHYWKKAYFNESKSNILACGFKLRHIFIFQFLGQFQSGSRLTGALLSLLTVTMTIAEYSSRTLINWRLRQGC